MNDLTSERRAFLVCGPESAGNRTLAALLVSAGCIGDASTAQPYDGTRWPAGESPVVLIRSVPHGEQWPDLGVVCTELEGRGYEVTALVPARDAFCMAVSQVERGHQRSREEALAVAGQAYRRIFGTLPADVRTIVVTYESLVLHGPRAAIALLREIGLGPPVAPLRIDGQPAQGLIDRNACRYGVARPLDATFLDLAERALIWLPEHGMGFYPVTAQPYGEAYFAKYRGYAETELGRALTAARLQLVARHYKGWLCDVGIGCGQFIEARGAETYGFDVNPAAEAWLRERNLYVDPRYGAAPACSFWDSLEHIAEPRRILDNVGSWVFVSLPVFRGAEHVMRSRHFRRDEHVWYWTGEGFVAWMSAQGFRLRERNRMETELGRDGIESFAFERTCRALS